MFQHDIGTRFGFSRAQTSRLFMQCPVILTEMEQEKETPWNVLQEICRTIRENLSKQLQEIWPKRVQAASKNQDDQAKY